MSTNISTTFIAQYEAEVKHAYQRMGSKLRNTIRTKNGVVGTTTTFKVIGKGAATQKATTHDDITTMNIGYTNASCTLADWYAGDYVDKLDEAKINHDERRVQAEAGAYALGRKTDDLIITALGTTTNTIAHGSAGMTLAKIYDALTQLGDNDSFDGGRKFCLVGYKQWTELLQLKEFASADYVDVSNLPHASDGAQGKFWLNTLFMPHTALTVASQIRSCFWYNENSLGHAIGVDLTADIGWVVDKAAHFINHFMSMGACMIEDGGVIEILCDES